MWLLVGIIRGTLNLLMFPTFGHSDLIGLGVRWVLGDFKAA